MTNTFLKSVTPIVGLVVAFSMLTGTASAQQSYRPGQSFSTARDTAPAQRATAPAQAPTANLPVVQPVLPAPAASVRPAQQPQRSSAASKAAAGNLYNLKISTGDPASKTAPKATAGKSGSTATASKPSQKDGVKKTTSVSEKPAAKSIPAKPARETAEAAKPAPSKATPSAAASTPDSTDKLVFFSRKTGKKQVALTYDDGPNPNLTPKLMEWLKANNVPATFFVQGIMVKTHPELTKKLASEGFELANHTYSHPDLRKQSPEKITDELQNTHDLVKDATGIDMRLMRPPYGAHNAKVNQICEKLGYKIINWDVDTEDWRNRSAEAMIQTIMSKAGDGSIILMHDRLHKGKDTVLETTKAVVPLLRAKGYTFVTVGELLEQTGPSASATAAAPEAPADLETVDSAPAPAPAVDSEEALPAPAVQSQAGASSDSTAMLNLLP